MTTILDDELLPGSEKKFSIRIFGIIRLVTSIYYSYRMLFIGSQVRDEIILGFRNYNFAYLIGAFIGLLIILLPIYYSIIQGYWEIKAHSKRFEKRRFRRISIFIFSFIICISIYNILRYPFFINDMFVFKVIFIIYLLLVLSTVILDLWYEAKRMRRN